MDKKIKDYISAKKLSDEDIYTLLTAEPLVADEEQENESDEESEVEEDLTTEDQEVEEDATEEQPDMRAMIKEILAEELHAMKKGKKAPKVKKTTKTKAPVAINRVFGAL